MARHSRCRSVTAYFVVVALSTAASANTIFYDDFNDGNAQDGMPVTWVPVSAFPGTFDASSGDYLLAPSQRAIVTAVPNSSWAMRRSELK
jgi:hypothetical protein